MEVMWWWLGASVLAALVLVGLVRVLWRPRRHQGDDHELWFANAGRLRRLPRFRALVSSRLRWLRAGLAGLTVACLGAALLVSRLVVVSDDDALMRNRDVMLCLDVSASMEKVDVPVVDAYEQVSGRLGTERIGLVAFDSGAVTLFPLTNDQSFVQQALSQVGDQVSDLSGGGLPGTRIGDSGSSLIGDGLASCANRFDRLDEQRSRTIVLATDGLVSGQPIYTIDEAAKIVQRKGIMLFVVAPATDDRDAYEALRSAARSTGGDILPIQAGQPTDTQLIVNAVEAQQKKAILAAPRQRSFDQPWPGALLVCLGLTALTVADWRGRR